MLSVFVGELAEDMDINTRSTRGTISNQFYPRMPGESSTLQQSLRPGEKRNIQSVTLYIRTHKL